MASIFISSLVKATYGSGLSWEIDFKKFDFICPRSGLVQSAIAYPRLGQLEDFSTFASLKQTKSIRNDTFEAGTSICFDKV